MSEIINFEGKQYTTNSKIIKTMLGNEQSATNSKGTEIIIVYNNVGKIEKIIND